MKYTNAAWENVGAAQFYAGNADYTSIFIDGGSPYVDYKDGGNGNKATVMKFGN